MKLPIKKEYFDMIRSGEKYYEFREAHITFVCEETGETLRAEVVMCHLADEEHAEQIKASYPELFDDKENLIVFKLSVNSS